MSYILYVILEDAFFLVHRSTVFPAGNKKVCSIGGTLHTSTGGNRTRSLSATLAVVPTGSECAPSIRHRCDGANSMNGLDHIIIKILSDFE